MQVKMWTGVLAILVSLGTVCGESGPRVKTEFGVHRGIWTKTVRQHSVATFLGIPYAKPPIGDRRFQNPTPLTKHWRRARDATKYVAPCSAAFGDKGNEDCLYLNIFTQQEVQYARRPENYTGRAVLVFLISTSDELGSNNNSLYNSNYLLDQDVVLVTVNYRLGFFGFFTTGDEAAPGNYGLKDVLEALNWIQKNIAAFGGDPEEVTLMGHGVGAGVVHLLALSDKSEGLFHRYITQSGTALSPWSYRPQSVAKDTSLQFAASMNCQYNTTEEVVDCMRNIPANASIDPRWSETVSPWVAYGPTDEPESEDAVITQHPKTLMLDGAVRNIPWLTGVVADEGLLHTIFFKENATLCDGLEKYFEFFVFSKTNQQQIVDDPAVYIEDLATYYFDGNFTECADTLTELIGDLLVNWPVCETVKIQVDTTESDIYFYSFEYNGTFTTTFKYDEIRYGVSHGDDLNYLFPVLNDCFDDLLLRNTENDITMINIVTEMWANFAKTGVPEVRYSPSWDSYREEQRYLEFDQEAAVSMRKGFLEDRMTFWHNLTEKHFPLPEYATGGGRAGSTWVDAGYMHILSNILILIGQLTFPAIFLY